MKEYTSYISQLEALREAGRFRELRPIDGRSGKYVLRGGRRLLNLSSNDYLGFATDAELQAEFYAGLTGNNVIDRYGSGGSASRLMTGSTSLCAELETLIGQSYGKEALLFNSGYHANLGILPALTGPRDLILSDKLNHASIIDGLRLARAKFMRYRHCDVGHCADLLEKERGKYDRAFIVTESVFSMDGDVAPLQELVELKQRYNAFLYVDEAHAVGVRGKAGLGVCEDLGIIDDVDLIMGTFGKALGSLGAFAVLDGLLRETLINLMRPFIFTTALPPVVISWNLAVFNQLDQGEVRRKALATLSKRFRESLSRHGLTLSGDSQIVPIIVGSDQRAVDLAAELDEAGYLALAVRPPTVPPNTSRLRLSLCANMAWDDIAELVPLLCHGVRGSRR